MNRVMEADEDFYLWCQEQDKLAFERQVIEMEQVETMARRPTPITFPLTIGKKVTYEK